MRGISLWIKPRLSYLHKLKILFPRSFSSVASFLFIMAHGLTLRPVSQSCRKCCCSPTGAAASLKTKNLLGTGTWSWKEDPIFTCTMASSVCKRCWKLINEGGQTSVTAMSMSCHLCKPPQWLEVRYLQSPRRASHFYYKFQYVCLKSWSLPLRGRRLPCVLRLTFSPNYKVVV